MRILLQFPEGLKQKAIEYARRYESEGHEVLISASPTFGACDLAIDEARSVKADKLVHFGHAEFQHVDAGFEIEYVEYYITASLGILKETLSMLNGKKRIGIVTTIQHVPQLKDVIQFYKDNGKEVIIGKPYGAARFDGQILGCDAGSAASIDNDVDAFVYFGGGIFHPLGAVLSTTKPFVSADPFMNRAEIMDGYREVYRKKSRGKMMGAIEAKTFGILVSTKNGQRHMDLANSIKDEIRGRGLNAEILVANTFDFDSINNMTGFDAFVNTACPRISLDDYERLRKPLLSPAELTEMFGIKYGKRSEK